MSKAPGKHIHFHTDCAYFAGCENMLPNFWANDELRAAYDVTFSFRASPPYTQGLHRRAQIDFPVYPLAYPDPSYVAPLPAVLAPNQQRALRFVQRALFSLPLLVYELIVLTRLLRRLQPDILHINNGGYPGALSCRAAALAGRLAGIKKIIMVVNNMAFPYSTLERKCEYFLDRLVVHAVDYFVTGSRAAALQLQTALGLPDRKLVARPNGIVLRAPTERREETRTRLNLGGFTGVVLGVVAAMEERKGHTILFQALAHLKNDGRVDSAALTVLLVGDGPLCDPLQAETRSRGLTDMVRFVGTEDNIAHCMRLLDLLVLPSLRNEDFPYVVIEAMAYGKPVIASAVAGTPEQITNGVTGLLVPPGDPVALADAIALLITDAPLRRRMGENAAAEFAARFSAAEAVARYLDLYDGMLRN